MVEHIEVHVAEGDLCDFCSSPDPMFLEDAASFDDEDFINGHSEGGWASCQICHDLVRARKWHTLERRATDMIAAKNPDVPRSRVAAAVQHMHSKFRHHQRPDAD